MKLKLIGLVLSVTTLLTACKKNDPENQVVPIQPAKGVYVLSEGGFGGNNATLAYRSAATGTVSGNFYLQQNPLLSSGLGDLANDMVVYGGKMYIVMNGSGNVTVLNAQTGALISKISFLNGTTNKSPRYAVGTKGKLFVTAYDNTVSVIDTTSLSITNSITVGPNPEGIATTGNYLYVANSGAFNFPDVDSTVSVIDLTTLTEIKKITVGKNPNKVEVSTNGDVYVSAYGNFGTIPAGISVINSATNTLKRTLGTGFEYSHVRISGEIAYFHNNYGGSGTAKVYNTTTETIVRNEFVTDGTSITVPYGINVDEQNGDVYIADAKDFTSSGEVTCFDKNGVKKFMFSVSPGINPNKILFVR
ncbi:MAG: YncE family protein [Ferruginibacter sp.]